MKQVRCTRWLLFSSLFLCTGGCASAFAAIDKFFGGNGPYEPTFDMTPNSHFQPVFTLRADGGIVADGGVTDVESDASGGN